MTFEYMEFYGWTEDLNDLGAEGWDAVTLNYDYPHKVITGVLKRATENQVVIQQGVSIHTDPYVSLEQVERFRTGVGDGSGRL